MNRVWLRTASILTGLCFAATLALPQAYTISAKPGVVNYVEGSASLNGHSVSPSELRSTALNAGDVLSTEVGKAEVLLTPGVFLRLGSNSEVHMISPSLIDTQLELRRGEAMIEVDQIVDDCRISVLNHGASILIEKSGLYRFNADDAPRVAVIDGKAQVYLGDKKLDLGKGREVVLSDLLKPEKFDRKKEDELYAWSNARSEYNASVSYQAAQAAPVNGYSAYPSGLGYGYAGGGWLWNAGFNSWAWLPGDGAFFSPFGWGFFSPGVVAYAPVVAVPIGGRGRWQGRGMNAGDRHHGHRGGGSTASNGTPGRPGRHAWVPVNPNRPPAMGLAASPWADHMARRQAARAAWAAGGFQTSGGASSPGFNAAQGGGGGHRGWSGSRPAGSPGGGWQGGAGRSAAGGGGGWHGGAGRSAGGSGGGWHGGGGGSAAGGGGGMGGGGGSRGGGGGNHGASAGGAGGTHGR
jgi:hypothetical protein